MKVEQELYAVVAPNGEIFNCWTSPNRLYETKASATRVRNQFIREAEDMLKQGNRYDTPKQIKERAALRQAHLDKVKLLQVKKVTIIVK
jgi:hypothetical protein